MYLSRQGLSLCIWMAVFTVIITLVITLRFWAARIKKRPLGPDDYMIVVAYINTLALQGTTWWGIANGLGAHTEALDKYELGVQAKILLGTGVTWLIATGFCKLSILWFYTCIFTTRRFKYAAWVLMGIVSAYCVAFICVFLTNCHPVSYSWHPVPGGYCTSVTVEEITSVSTNMVIDAAVVVLPMPPLWKLKMATRKKVAISLLFGLGLLVVAISGWRIQITVQSVTKTDFVYGLGNIGLVTHLEVWIGIIVACLPTLTPFLSKYFKHLVVKLPWTPRHSGSPSPKKLKEAKHTFGSSQKRGGKRKKAFNRLYDHSLLEMEEGKTFSSAQATSGTSRGPGKDSSDSLTGIGVRQDVQVIREAPGF